ncbi:DinB family protein [Alcaligenes sp. SDU_A2]|uniref:DinB family protein n=1 Tax=Alcaligenes sp. SDU_A2 TaxID=3136634 RepID=UPI00311FF0DC
MSQAASGLVQLMAHKQWMDKGMYTALQAPEYAERPEMVERALYWLNHNYIVDQIFKGHLLGQPCAFTSTVSTTFPPLQELCALSEALNEWLVDYAGQLDDISAKEEIEFVYTDGDRGLMTRAQMLMHLSSHGLCHISVTAQALSSQGLPVPPLLFSTYLNQEVVF